jgi:hypothetical protein
MELFHEIVGHQAIVRFRNNVLKQTKVFRRGSEKYIPHAGGFIRILPPFGRETTNPTTIPGVTVIEMGEA